MDQNIGRPGTRVPRQVRVGPNFTSISISAVRDQLFNQAAGLVAINDAGAAKLNDRVGAGAVVREEMCQRQVLKETLRF
jgi:hypothetical protein